MSTNVDLSESQFRFEWFSGTGKGGQHRNKHQNCCRCIHTETGTTAIGTENRSRESNKRDALSVCRARVASLYHQDTERYRASDERVRTYHAERNEVIDHASGDRAKYTEVIDGDALGRLVEARLMAKAGDPGEPAVMRGAA